MRIINDFLGNITSDTKTKELYGVLVSSADSFLILNKSGGISSDFTNSVDEYIACLYKASPSGIGGRVMDYFFVEYPFSRACDYLVGCTEKTAKTDLLELYYTEALKIADAGDEMVSCVRANDSCRMHDSVCVSAMKRYLGLANNGANDYNSTNTIISFVDMLPLCISAKNYLDQVKSNEIRDAYYSEYSDIWNNIDEKTNDNSVVKMFVDAINGMPPIE